MRSWVSQHSERRPRERLAKVKNAEGASFGGSLNVNNEWKSRPSLN
ncbi:MAG: hypothetical protein ACTS4Z_01350 [Candidatus Hodgkinia cicadicola]